VKHRFPLGRARGPRTLDEYIGQEHIVGEGKLLRRTIEADKLFSSIILWGPPGTDKIAQVIANTTRVTSPPSPPSSLAKQTCAS
jgi:putative ATPase